MRETRRFHRRIRQEAFWAKFMRRVPDQRIALQQPGQAGNHSTLANIPTPYAISAHGLARQDCNRWVKPQRFLHHCAGENQRGQIGRLWRPPITQNRLPFRAQPIERGRMAYGKIQRPGQSIGRGFTACQQHHRNLIHQSRVIQHSPTIIASCRGKACERRGQGVAAQQVFDQRADIACRPARAAALRRRHPGRQAEQMGKINTLHRILINREGRGQIARRCRRDFRPEDRQHHNARGRDGQIRRDIMRRPACCRFPCRRQFAGHLRE